jgi:hypothetical protein
MFNDAVEQTASPLSREAATECSPQPALSPSQGRKPWEKRKTEKPQRGERLALTHTL